MFKLLGVTFLQPEHVIGARVPGGAAAIGSLLTSVQELLRDRYDDNVGVGSRTLTLALGPDRRLQLWLATDEGTTSPDEQNQLRELATRLVPPEVQVGPIVLALVFSIGNEPPPEAQLALPDEWRVVLQTSDTTLSVEQIISRLAPS